MYNYNYLWSIHFTVPNPILRFFPDNHGSSPPLLEMFLDRTDLSKTVDRHGTERCHVLSRSSRFFAAVLLERQAVLVERGPVLAKNG